VCSPSIAIPAGRRLESPASFSACPRSGFHTTRASFGVHSCHLLQGSHAVPDADLLAERRASALSAGGSSFLGGMSGLTLPPSQRVAPSTVDRSVVAQDYMLLVLGCCV
jgi:hypothetical protein